MTRARAIGAAALLSLGAAPARAQLGELQIGALAAYGAPGSYGRGAGLVLGVATGRLAYVGARWTSYAGETATTGGATADEVRNQTRAFTADVGADIPIGRLEVFPFVSAGAMRFSQRARLAGGGPGNGSFRATEFLIAPGLAVEFALPGIAVIPELQYYFVGRPDLPWPIEHRGVVAGVRLVVTKELRRIRR